MELYDPEIHAVHNTEVSRVLKGALGEPRLITYRHARTGMWCLGIWSNRDGFIHEIDPGRDMPVSASGIPYADADYVSRVRRCFRDPEILSMRAHIRKGAQRHRDNHEETIRAHREAAAEARAYYKMRGSLKAEAPHLQAASPDARLW